MGRNNFFSRRAWLALPMAIGLSQALLVPPESTFMLGNTPYLVDSTPSAQTCHGPTTSQDSLLLTVFKTNETYIDDHTLSALFDQYSQVDDVWSPQFLESVAILAPTNANLTSSAYSWLASHQVQYLYPQSDIVLQHEGCNTIPTGSIQDTSALLPGPYQVSFPHGCAEFSPVYRLYEDNLRAFTQGMLPKVGCNGFSSSMVHDVASLNLLIPVPSRLRSLDDTRPLAGLRMAVKDLFFVEGLKTGGGSRVYQELYSENNFTAPAVTKLLDLGVVAVGLTNLSQFAWGTEPWKWNDIEYPWNPRGDGWLEVAFSYSGSGAAIVGYDWLDIAMGSDTGGSMRMPAALGGSYGIRPTHNAMDLTGALPQSSLFDTAGFFARDPLLFSKVGPLWYDNGGSEPANRSFTGFPKKILYPVDYLPLDNPAAQEVYDGFISSMSKAYGMTVEKINVTATLHASNNTYIYDKPSTESLFSTAVRFDSTSAIGDPLLAKWEAAYPDAGFPPFDLETRTAYSNPDRISQQDYDDVIARKGEFKAFSEEHILRPSEKTCSESLMVLDSGAGGLPSYREEFLNHQPGAGFLYMTNPKQWLNPLLLSPLLSAPQVDLPVGQVDYQSVISLQTEKLPVVIDLMAAPGCDFMLYKLVEDLAKKGLLKSVKTGRVAF